MKNLTSLFLAGMLAISPVIGQEKNEEIKTPKDYLLQLGVPEKFADYQGSVCWYGPINLGGYLYGLREYDVDDDGEAEIQEIYRITSQDSDGKYYGPEHPLVYGFDLDEDGNFGEEGEVIQDKTEDGINGNEIWFIPISSKNS